MINDETMEPRKFRCPTGSGAGSEIMKHPRGQALLPLLILMTIFLTLGVGVFHLSISGMLLGSYLQAGEAVLVATEGTLENGLLEILRNPSYNGESLQVGGFPCTIGVSGSVPLVMTAECDSGRAIRRLQAEINFVDGEMTVSNLREIE